MASIRERWVMTENELRAIFRANAAKARPFVYMSDSDNSYEDECDHGLKTPPPEPISTRRPRRPRRSQSPSETKVEHEKNQISRVTKQKASKKSPRYPFTRSRGCERISLDLRRKGFLNYRPGTKTVQVSFRTYMRDHDPDRWSHLTPEEHRERNFNIWRRRTPAASYRILPDGTFQPYETLADETIQPLK